MISSSLHPTLRRAGDSDLGHTHLSIPLLVALEWEVYPRVRGCGAPASGLSSGHGKTEGSPADLLTAGCRAQDGCILAWKIFSPCSSLSTQLQIWGSRGSSVSLSSRVRVLCHGIDFKTRQIAFQGLGPLITPLPGISFLTLLQPDFHLKIVMPRTILERWWQLRVLENTFH